MNITWCEDSIKQLKDLTKGKEGIVKLIYDSEDCGCGDDGVSTLWFISEPEGNEILIDSNIGKMLLDKDKQYFLEENMKITWVRDLHSFRLSSANGIINPFMHFYNWVK